MGQNLGGVAWDEIGQKGGGMGQVQLKLGGGWGVESERGGRVMG